MQTADHSTTLIPTLKQMVKFKFDYSHFDMNKCAHCAIGQFFQQDGETSPWEVFNGQVLRLCDGANSLSRYLFNQDHYWCHSISGAEGVAEFKRRCRKIIEGDFSEVYPR